MACIDRKGLINMKLAIFQVTHSQKCQKNSKYILPIQVGTEDKFEPLRDNTKNNISCKNFCYSELTALYWIWKNVQCDVIGLYHYRRVFYVSSKEIYKAIENNQIIVTRPVYFKTSIKQQYASVHFKEDFHTMLEVLKAKYPEYYVTSQKVFDCNRLYCNNMFIGPQQFLHQYCSWLFDILFEVESRIGDVTQRTLYQQRYLGFLAERLFTLYVMHNKINVVPKNILFEGKMQRLNTGKNLAKNFIFTFNKEIEDVSV